MRRFFLWGYSAANWTFQRIILFPECTETDFTKAVATWQDYRILEDYCTLDRRNPFLGENVWKPFSLRNRCHDLLSWLLKGAAYFSCVWSDVLSKSEDAVSSCSSELRSCSCRKLEQVWVLYFIQCRTQQVNYTCSWYKINVSVSRGTLSWKVVTSSHESVTWIVKYFMSW